jgi:hypothetical protein
MEARMTFALARYIERVHDAAKWEPGVMAAKLVELQRDVHPDVNEQRSFALALIMELRSVKQELFDLQRYLPPVVNMTCDQTSPPD